MPTYPTQQLSPGQSGDAVKQLQDYLVSRGYMTREQVNTGYGYYGNQTKSAVLQLQKDLGIDYSSGPGYFGPRTLSALQQQETKQDVFTQKPYQSPQQTGSYIYNNKSYAIGTGPYPSGNVPTPPKTIYNTPSMATQPYQVEQPTQPAKVNPATTLPPATPQPAAQNGASTGVSEQTGSTPQPADVAQSQDQSGQTATSVLETKPEGMPDDVWNLLGNTEKSYFSPIWDYLNQQLEAGKQIPITLTTDELANLYEKAKNDPVIQKYYADQLRIGEADLKSGLAELKQQQALTATQQQQETKQLSEQEAAAGRAYSGFRQQAQQRLAEAQKGVVESSRRQMEKLGREAEQQFGTEKLQTMGGIPGYNLLGQIGGTLGTQKLADIEQKYQSLQKQSLQQKGATFQ